MTLQDHMIKGSGDFMEGNSSLYTLTQRLDPPYCDIFNIYRFTIPKSQIRLAKKREEKEGEEEQHRQLQSVMCFTQTRKEHRCRFKIDKITYLKS